MKFREEVFAKIFTYITVIALLGVVVFEGLKLYETKVLLSDTDNQLAAAWEELQYANEINVKLEEENANLSAFMTQWGSYAAIVEENEVLTLKEDLFSRPDLIPDDVSDSILKYTEELQKEDTKDNAKKKKEKETTVDFSFDNPNGDNIFLPLNTGLGENGNCLVYTIAFWDEEKMYAELIFEIDLTEQKTIAERDENGELNWICIAYNVGEGWVGVRMEEDLE